MADFYIENDLVKAGINAHGAELVSLVKKADGREYMWSGDAKYWGRVSPVLFPFIGKLVNASYIHNGKEYAGVPQHGYARDSEFQMVERKDDTIWFELTPDELWKERYPFEFVLRIGYRLEGKSIHVMWNVENRDAENLHFSIGAHPAFVMPNMDAKTGYRIDFHTDKKELVCGELNENGLLKAGEKTFALDNGVLTVTGDLFEKDALIIDSPDYHTVSLNTPEGVPFIQVRFDTPMLGIWSPVGKNAPFICIEPWFGRSDRDSYTGDLAGREHGNTIAPGHSFNKEYVIDIMD